MTRVSLIVVALLAARSASAVCTSDIQCAGDLICEKGECVPPAVPTLAQAPARPASPPARVFPTRAPSLQQSPVQHQPVSQCQDATDCGQGCERGDATACTNLGTLAESGHGGAPRDALQAALLYRRGCDGGDGRGCTRLGLAFHAGAGVKPDPVQAAVSARHGCELGDAEGCAAIAWYLDNGQGVLKDPSEAEGFYRKACSAGAADACVAAAGARQAPFSAVGLEWSDAAGPMNYAASQTYCAALSLAGGHWRLPTRNELVTLYQVKRSTPAVVYDRDAYWSSSRSDDSTATFVNFTGFDGSYDVSGALGVRCVR